MYLWKNLTSEALLSAMVALQKSLRKPINTNVVPIDKNRLQGTSDLKKNTATKKLS